MSTSSITCPHCNTPISLDEALTGQIKSKLEGELALSYEKKLKQQTAETVQQVQKQLAEESAKEMKFLQEQLEDKKRKLDEASEKELILRKREVELEEKERRRELDVARQIDEERKKIKETTEIQLLEQLRQKELEKDKQINDLKKLLEDAQRKANQGSQQTQGEVRELVLEELLRSTFPQDVIEPIGKGVHGADIRQIVRSNGGTVCGVILWESKQTKTWSQGWIGKLKDDLRSEKADICALVTAVFSEANWSGMTLHEGVWVCSTQLIVPLASLLRKALIDSAYQKAVAAHRGSKAELLYDYITGLEFRQQLEAIVEVFSEMNEQVQKERVAFEKFWTKREAQIKRLSLSTVSIVGSIQGLAGKSALPELKGVDLLDEGLTE